MAMRLTEYIHPECFIPDLAERNREEALRKIVNTAAEKGLLKNEKDVLARLFERESIQSTAVGNGIAIPHCFSDEIHDLIIIVGRSPGGIEFDSFDGKPIQVVFLLIGNRQEYRLHLKAFARIARLIKRGAFIEKIACSTTVEDMVRAFHEEEARIC